MRSHSQPHIALLLLLVVSVASISNAQTVSVDKACYRKGEPIQVAFNDIAGQDDVWIGLLKQGGEATEGNQLMDFVFPAVTLLFAMIGRHPEPFPLRPATCRMTSTW